MRLDEARIKREKDLAFFVTQGLMNAAIQANVDALGFETAFRALDKYISHNAKWCVTTASQVVGRDAKGVDGLLSLLHWYNDLCYRGSMNYGSGEDGCLELELKGCRATGIYPLICEWFCRREFIFMCDESNPELALELEKSLPKGDELCRWSISRRDGKLVTEKMIPFQDLGIPSAPIETMDYYAQAGAGEFFAMATACLVGSMGPEKALKLLIRNAMRFGEEFGAYFIMKHKKSGPEAAEEAMQLLDSLLQMKAEVIRLDESGLECQINACPFADSPIEICHQIEAFKTAAARVISPHTEFSYKEEKGDKVCHWTMQIVRPPDEERPRPEPPKADPLERLMNRLIDGEISEEEFERKMVLLKKHMPTK